MHKTHIYMALRYTTNGLRQYHTSSRVFWNAADCDLWVNKQNDDEERLVAPGHRPWITQSEPLRGPCDK